MPKEWSPINFSFRYRLSRDEERELLNIGRCFMIMSLRRKFLYIDRISIYYRFDWCKKYRRDNVVDIEIDDGRLSISIGSIFILRKLNGGDIIYFMKKNHAKKWKNTSSTTSLPVPYCTGTVPHGRFLAVSVQKRNKPVQY